MLISEFSFKLYNTSVLTFVVRTVYAEMDAVNISGKMSDMDFIIHILGNLPEEYKAAVESLEDKLDNSPNGLDLETI